MKYTIDIQINDANELPDVIAACAQNLGDPAFVQRMKDLKPSEDIALVMDGRDERWVALLTRTL